MKYQLKTGRTVSITLEQFLSMTDADIENMVASDLGHYIEDPFMDLGGSDYNPEPEAKIPDLPDTEPIPEEEIEEIKKQLEDE